MWMMKMNQWDKRTVDEFFVLHHSRYLHILQIYHSLTRRKQTLRKILHKQLIRWNFRMCGSRSGSFKVPNYKFEMKFRTNYAVTAPGYNIIIASKQTVSWLGTSDVCDSEGIAAMVNIFCGVTRLSYLMSDRKLWLDALVTRASSAPHVTRSVTSAVPVASGGILWVSLLSRRAACHIRNVKQMNTGFFSSIQLLLCSIIRNS